MTSVAKGRSCYVPFWAQIASWVKDYGEDSDFIRVRVRGVFPRAGTLQFIDSERIADATARVLEADPTAPLGHGGRYRAPR